MLRTISTLAIAVAFALPALAPAAADDAAVKARQAQFTLYSFNLGVLAGMAQGEVEYDSEAAQTAADNLVHLTSHDQGRMWPEGTDNASMEGTRAQPSIWEDLEDFANRFSALQENAAAMQGVAGEGLDEMRAALGDLAGTCQGCHQEHRASE